MDHTHPILGEYVSFLDTLVSRMEDAGVTLDELFQIDHLCYRVADELRYDEIKSSLSALSSLVSEEIINGRPISIFQLDDPLPYRSYLIPAIELPFPSATPYSEGLEHAEFVIDDIDRFMADHPNLAFITKDLKQPHNPHVAVKFGSIAAKFHTKEILEVVKLEKAARLA